MTTRRVADLRLHPDAERVPLASAADLAVLRGSLAEHGQQDPIDITPDGVILDGRTRWSLLQELRATTVEVRTVDVPASQQTNYIVDRALARRHLTAEQKRALNALLRETVMEVVPDPKTGEEIRIGRGQSQRAETLGVERGTIQNWDREADGQFSPTAPTHQRLVNGRIEPIHKEPREPKLANNGRSNRGQRPVARKRYAPAWTSQFALWCRRSRPEDRKLLLRLDAELHEALRQNDIQCEH